MTNTTTSIPTMRSANANATKYEAVAADTYPARLVRFVGLGIQEQPEFQGQKKDPAFKCSIQFELIGINATGKKADGTPVDPRPACVFQDYFLFPGASRGKVYDLCRAINPSMEKAPGNLEWFTGALGEAVLVQVGTYKTKTGETRNKVIAVSPMPSFMKGSLDSAKCDIVGFNPYSETESNFAAYSKLFKFQRDILMEAVDTANIPFAGKEPSLPPRDGNTTASAAAAIQGTTVSADSTVEDDDVPF